MTISHTTILHIDMDAFFAQVEILRDPSLKGKPVCVGGIPGQDRSVVTSASYEARQYGVHAGMPLFQAKRLCPNAVFVRSRGAVYMEISKRVVRILEEFSDRVQPSSIDESYVDITGVLNYFNGAENIGRQIKKRIVDELHLTCTVGIAPTRTLAKMATNLQKPDGLTIIAPEMIEEKIFPLKVEKIPGVGPALQKTLNNVGIYTIRELANASVDFLAKKLGAHGPKLQDIIKGKLDWEIVPDEDRPDEKSVGNSRTFRKDTNDQETLKGYLLSLVQMVGRRLRDANMLGRTVTLTIRYGDFNTVTHRKSSQRSLQDEREIFKLTWILFQEQYITGLPVRLLGVSVSNLTRGDVRQTDLFDKDSQLYTALDKLKDKYGEEIIRRSSTPDIRMRKHRENVHFAKPNRNEQQKRTGS